MRFEKLNEDKIRITLSGDELSKKHIDFHSFMANSVESQDLFFDMLNEAEKEIGFVTKDYQIRIEALAIASGDFVITVTRSLPEKRISSPLSEDRFSSNKRKVSDSFSKNSNMVCHSTVAIPRKRLKSKRKDSEITSTDAIYQFYRFEDFCHLCLFLRDHHLDKPKIANSIMLYQYKDTYYLSFENINLEYPYFKKLFSCMTEFACYVNHSSLLKNKLLESGHVIMKHNAIRTCLKHFA